MRARQGAVAAQLAGCGEEAAALSAIAEQLVPTLRAKSPAPAVAS